MKRYSRYPVLRFLAACAALPYALTGVAISAVVLLIVLGRL